MFLSLNLLLQVFDTSLCTNGFLSWKCSKFQQLKKVGSYFYMRQSMKIDETVIRLNTGETALLLVLQFSAKHSSQKHMRHWLLLETMTSIQFLYIL